MMEFLRFNWTHGISKEGTQGLSNTDQKTPSSNPPPSLALTKITPLLSYGVLWKEQVGLGSEFTSGALTTSDTPHPPY